ncbi:MAG: hypothetical protein AAFZ01_08615, partial [Pseudomonadota bacterium]
MVKPTSRNEADPIPAPARGSVRSSAGEETPPAILRDEIAFSWVREVAELEALETSWRSLEHRDTTTVFQTFEWVRHWCRHYVEQPRKRFGRTRQNCLAIVVGRMAGKVVTIWPLTQKCGVRTARLEWLGVPVSQYGDALFADEVDPVNVACATLEFLSRHSKSDALVLTKVRECSPLTEALVASNATCTGTDTAPFLSLQEDGIPAHSDD